MQRGSRSSAPNRNGFRLSAAPQGGLFLRGAAVRTFAAIFEADGRQVASYAIVAETPERANHASRYALAGRRRSLRILDEEGREALALERADPEALRAAISR